MRSCKRPSSERLAAELGPLPVVRRRRETAERIEVEAEAVMREYAVRAYGEARRREGDAKSNAEAQNWSRVALAIARKINKRVGLDTASRMASDANFAAFLELSASPSQAPISELDALDELSRLVSDDTPRGYRIHFLGPGTDQTQTVLAEVAVRASDVSTAMSEVVRTPWPPRAAACGWSILMGARSSDDGKANAVPSKSRRAIARRHWLATVCS